MKKIFNFIALILFGVLQLPSCSKYETQYEGPYSDTDSTINQSTNYIYEIICVQGGKLYAMDRVFRSVKQLPTTGSVVQASINYSHDKIAYKTSSGNVQVIDSAGVLIASIPNSIDVKWFDWHSNNQSLYMLNAANKIVVYGTPLTLSTTNAGASIPYLGQEDINSIAVTPDGTVLASYMVYDGLNYQNGIYYVSKTGQSNNFFLFNLNYNAPMRLRLREDGTEGVSVFTDISGFNPASYSFSIVPNAYQYQLGSTCPIVAISPDGAEKIVITSDLIAIYNLYSGRSITPGTGTFTDLDW
jgi:hypothetical protein